MLDVMIVDDDTAVRERLKAIINWEDLGLRLICEAADSDTARELFQTYNPSIVITDICIPIISGLELAEELAEINPYVRFIVITGYNDFEYAKRVVRLGAIDLLSKPLFADEINQSLLRAVQHFDEDRQRVLQAYSLPIKRDDLQLLKESLIRDILDGRLSDEELILRKLRLFEITMPLCAFCAAIIDIGACDNKELIEGIRITLTDTIRRNYRQNELQVFSYTDSVGKIHCILNFTSAVSNDIIEESFNQLQKYLKLISNLTIYIGIGYAVSKLCELPQSHLEAQITLSYQTVVNDNTIIHYQNIKHFDSHSHRAARYCDYLVQLFRENALEQLIFSFETHISTLQIVQKNQRNNLVAEFCAEFMHEITKASIDMGLSIQRIEKIGFSVAEMYGRRDPLIQVEYVLGCTKNLLAELFGNREKNTNYLIDLAKKYAQEHLDDPNLDLNKVSNAVSLSYVYFCKLFHKVEGITFNNYLKKLRIEQAKNLLIHSSLRVSEVGDKVGFSNSKYFGYAFKKEVGMTPSEFQKKSQR